MTDSGTPSSQRMMGISLSYDYRLERNVGAGVQLAAHEKIIAPCIAKGDAPSGAQQFAALTVGRYHSLAGPVIG